jgi:uncharacterized protein involved in exopolysaccharide biosynthesis
MAVFPQQSISRKSILNFLSRNLALIVVSGTIAAFWMLIYTFAIYKPSYSAKSVVIIKDSALTRRFVEPEQGYALQTTTSSSSNPVLNTMGILKSSAISSAVYEYFLKHHPEYLKKYKIKSRDDWDAFFGDGSAFIKAKNQSGTDLISIQFSWSNPQIAKEALETVVKAFQNASRDLNKEEQVSRTHFMDRQVQEIEAQLEAIRAQKSSYQSRMGTVNIQQEGINLAANRLELNNKLNQIEAQARGKEEQLARYEEVLGMSSDKAVKAMGLGQNQVLNRLHDELYRLQQLYSQQLWTLGENDPATLETRAQIIQARANIRAEQARTLGKAKNDAVGLVPDIGRNTIIANMVTVQGEAKDLRAQANELRTRLAQLDEQIQAFPQMAEALTSITQKESSLSTALDQLRQKVLEGRLKEEQTLSNVFVVDAPHLPESPEFPSRSHLILLSLVVGVASGIAIALIKEQLFSDETPDAPDWLENMDEDEGPAEIEVPAYPQPVPSSLFNSLVPIAGPILTMPGIEQREADALDTIVEEVDVHQRVQTAKGNPYMHAPGKGSARKLQAALQTALQQHNQIKTGQ